jgi:hypothetical protein
MILVILFGNVLNMDVLTLTLFSGNQHIMPHKWVSVNIEAFAHDSASGDWTMLAYNGTMIAVDASIVNPVASSASNASTVLGIGPGSDSVQTS